MPQQQQQQQQQKQPDQHTYEEFQEIVKNYFDPASQQQQICSASQSHSSASEAQQQIQQSNNSASYSILAAPDAAARIQLKQMALQQAREARPTEPFETGSSVEYSSLMSTFDAAVAGEALDAREKLLELAKWFKGSAHKIVAGHSMYRDDPEGNYAKARSRLDQLFRLHHNSFSATIEQIIQGKQLAPFDYKGHLALFAELSQAHSMVNSTGNEEFDRPDVVRKIVNSRLEHYSTKFWIKDGKKIRQTGKAMSFEDLLDELQNWMVVLVNRGANEKHEQSNNNSSNGNNNINGGKNSARVNATSSRGKGSSKQPVQQAQPETMAQHIMSSPPQQQSTIRCGVCDSLHDTNDCQLLANLSIDERLQRLGQKGLCFHCFRRGHTARNCTQKPRCNSCNRLHNTLMCQRRTEYRNGMQNELPFQPAHQSNQPAQYASTPAQNTAYPAQNNTQASVPPPHGPPVQPSAPAAATHPII